MVPYEIYNLKNEKNAVKIWYSPATLYLTKHDTVVYNRRSPGICNPYSMHSTSKYSHKIKYSGTY